MNEIDGIAFHMLAFDKTGKEAERTKPLFPEGITDLIIVSHGWKNDEEDAKALYQGFVKGMVEAAGGTLGTERSFAVIGISWPSFRYLPDLSLLRDSFDDADGAAASEGDTDVPDDQLETYARDIAQAFDIEDPEQFVVLADEAGRNDDEAADALIERLKTAAHTPKAGDDAAKDHAPLFEQSGRDLVEDATFPPPAPNAPPQEADDGDAASLLTDARTKLGNWLAGRKAGVARILNQFTYYEMKARAGTVGEALAAILNAEAKDGPHIHLVGHSFGARLVTAAANKLNRDAASLTLLQGAFSHNGFRDEGPQGAFRAVRGKVEGPIVITHTHNDTAVGFYYAVASLASGVNASNTVLSYFIGGPGDTHGGLGANGAQGLDEPGVKWIEGELGVVPKANKGCITNIRADSFIRDHNDVGADRAGPVIWAAIKG